MDYYRISHPYTSYTTYEYHKEYSVFVDFGKNIFPTKTIHTATIFPEYSSQYMPIIFSRFTQEIRILADKF